MTPSLRDLRPFEAIDDTILRTRVERTGPVLSLRYVLRAPAGRWRVPVPRLAPARADRLWEHTCFEAFLAPVGMAPYWEINLSPSGDWNTYRFDGYREGMRPETRAQQPAVRLERASCGTLTFGAVVDLEPLTELTVTPLDVGLGAVLESSEGTLAYWALAHAGAKPDFHERTDFLVRLGPEDDA